MSDQGNVIEHPTARRRKADDAKRFAAVADRWMKLKRQHRNFCDVTWLGIMVREFSDDDLALIAPEYFCENDRQQLRRAGRLPAAREARSPGSVALVNDGENKK
jgi:hypothetical protein